MNPTRIMLAVLLAPFAMPLCFRVVLSFYVKEPVEHSLPLLPGYEGMMMYLSLLVTMFIGLPGWIFVRRRWKVTGLRAIMVGVLLGLALATMFLQSLSWPAGLLLWTGALGGGTTAMIFVLIAGKQPNFPASDQSLNSAD